MVLLLANTAATLFMTGLIWCIQILHYPMLARFPRDSFVDCARDHARRISIIVIPVMLSELVVALLLPLQLRGTVLMPWSVWGLFLLGVIWLSTFLLQVPCHRILQQGFDAPAHRKLVLTNWIRTTAWTLRSVLALSLLAAEFTT